MLEPRGEMYRKRGVTSYRMSGYSDIAVGSLWKSGGEIGKHSVQDEATFDTKTGVIGSFRTAAKHVDVRRVREAQLGYEDVKMFVIIHGLN